MVSADKIASGAQLAVFFATYQKLAFSERDQPAILFAAGDFQLHILH